MSLIPPRQNDFNQILLDLGQTITLRKYTRTVDDDGRITAVSTADTDISAIVEEVGLKKIDLIAAGHYNVGDILFFINPDSDITIFDKVVWGTKLLGIKEIKYDQMIAGYYIYKTLRCVKDSEVE